MVGLPSLRALLQPEAAMAPVSAVVAGSDEAGLAAMVDDLARAGRGLIMVMGKGGVGKTTVAAAIAVGQDACQQPDLGAGNQGVSGKRLCKRQKLRRNGCAGRSECH
jgi:ABC-type branched-subunit amino acid transport system ATPase component